MHQQEIDRVRQQAMTRILLHPDGQRALDRLKMERDRLRAVITPLHEWFADIASDYRGHRDELSSLAQMAGEYWSAALVSDHLQHLEYHINKVDEHFCGTFCFLDQHEACHPLIHSLLEHLPEHEMRYGPLFLYTWMPVSAWVGDLTMTWWDGPSVPEMRAKPRCNHTRAEVTRNRHYTIAGLETVRNQWCKTRGKDPAQFPIVLESDGYSATLQGYIPRSSQNYREWTLHNHLMDWAGRQSLPPVVLTQTGR